jgi:hypothetical protein
MATAIPPAASPGYFANPVFNALVPKEGPKVVPVLLNYSQFGFGSNSFNVDFRDLIEGGQIYCIQSVFIDNWNNATEVDVTVQGTGQVVRCPANSQGVFPVFAQKVARFTVSSTATADVPTFWLNVPVAPYIVTAAE